MTSSTFNGDRRFLRAASAPRLLFALRRLLGASSQTRAVDPDEHVVAWGLTAAVFSTAAIGLLALAWADEAARLDASRVEFAAWLSLVMVHVPFALRLLAPRVADVERFVLVVALGLVLLLVKVFNDPLGPSYYDELEHWATASELLRTGRLFGANPLLPISPHYPGLELVATALAQMLAAPLSITTLLTVALSRIALMSGFYCFFKNASGSSHTAAVAMLVYTGSDLVFFDGQFAYETMAFGMLACVLGLDSLIDRASPDRRITWYLLRRSFGAGVLLFAIAATHHLTSFYAAVLFIANAAMRWLGPAPARRRITSLVVALLAVTAPLLWTWIAGDLVTEYLAPALSSSLRGLRSMLELRGGDRPAFTSGSGVVAPAWKQAVSIGSLACLSAGLAFGFFRALRPISVDMGNGHHTILNRSWPIVLTAVTLLFPVATLLRLTRSGWEVADRATAFIFLGVAFVVAIGVSAVLHRRRGGLVALIVLGGLAEIVFIGGLLSGCCTVVPGPYAVAADSLSVEPFGLAAAAWMRDEVGSRSRVGTDRINQVLMGAFGGADVVTMASAKIDLAPLILRDEASAEDYAIIREARIRFLVVDQRLASGRPKFGFYFQEGEPSELDKEPPSRQALAKFDHKLGFDRVYDSGALTIYDAAGLRESDLILPRDAKSGDWP